MINNLIKRIEKLLGNKPWMCQGGRGGKPPHPIQYNNLENCIQCGLPRPDSSDEQKPQKDNLLLAALAILNVGSGITTIVGATQIFPRFLGYTSGATIQVLLFLLVSGSTLKHAAKLKWLTVGSLSILSVYTSVFAYYDTLVGQEKTQKALERAKDAHGRLIREVYNPMKQKVESLKFEIRKKDKELDCEETNCTFDSIIGQGPKYAKILKEKIELDNKLDRLQTTVDTLIPLFDYELISKSPEEIFEADKKALNEVPLDCLPEDQGFNCLPQEYKEILEPNSLKYKQLRDRYFDEDTRYQLLEPYHKITKGESPAIAAALLALMVDGLIIALGTAVEIRQRQTFKKVTLQLQGTGSAFLNEFLKAIDSTSLTIDYKILQKLDDTGYLILLESIRTNTQWIKKGDNREEWEIADADARDQLLNWLLSERQRHLNKETTCTVHQYPESYQSSRSSQRRNIIFLLPS